jgi:hypothetical protein
MSDLERNLQKAQEGFGKGGMGEEGCERATEA